MTDFWNDFDCDCSEEYGPCEDHGELLVLREGASTRTADELSVIYLLDLANLGVDIGEGKALVGEYWLATNNSGGWIDPELYPGLMEAIRDCELQVSLPENTYTFWDDGYRIVKLTDDCPLLEA